MSAQCLILGMSHIEAIRRGMPEAEKCTADFVSLNESAAVFDKDRNTLNLESIDSEKYEHVFLSIGGNFHNIIGLIENPVPFTVHGDAQVGSEKHRTLIPRGMMLDLFRQRLQGLTMHFAPLREHFSQAKMHHVCSPPPIENDEHVIQNPGVFRSRLSQGIAPKSLRLNLYDIQKELYAEKCEDLAINVIEPPRDAVSEDGFLKGEYLNNDPTHGNAKYGAQVWTQIKGALEHE